jgi:hypothetical protein
MLATLETQAERQTATIAVAMRRLPRDASARARWRYRPTTAMTVTMVSPTSFCDRVGVCPSGRARRG